MSDHLDDLQAAARSVAAKYLRTDSTPESTLDRGLWSELEGLGFVGVTMPERLGGSGGDLLDSVTVLGEVGCRAVPYAEATVIAAPLLATTGLDIPTGPFTAGELFPGETPGEVPRVPFARNCDHVVVLDASPHPSVQVFDLGALTVREGVNLAGEPRDTVLLAEAVPVAASDVTPTDVEAWRLRAALARAVATAGAAARVLELTVAHVKTRTQFGRALIEMQAVQQMVARMAAEATALQIAATAASTALLEDPASAELLVAAAKGESASLSASVAAAAHQAHGAIGFTREHPLGALTTRLWAWREEHGNERYWFDRVGELSGRDDLWSIVAG